jgi:hypothetical protein
VPLLPIDLQTLFGQAPQVGREQNVQREGVPLAQAQQGAAIVRQAGVQDTSVNELQQQAEGPEQARIRERRRGRRDTGTDRERRKNQPQKKPPQKPPQDRDERDIARDPALGRHVDVSG